MDAATIDHIGLWAVGGGLTLSAVSGIALNGADPSSEEKEAAQKAILEASNDGLTRTAPSFVSFTKPDTGEPIGQRPAWCAGFVVDGCETAAFGYGPDGLRCVVQLKAPDMPEIRVVHKDGPAAQRLASRLTDVPDVGRYRGSENFTVYSSDEQFARAARNLAAVPTDSLLTPDPDRVPDEADRPQAIALADGVVSIEFTAPGPAQTYDYARQLLALVRDVPDRVWREHVRTGTVTLGQGGRPFRPKPTPRQQLFRVLTVVGLAPLFVAAVLFGVAEISRTAAFFSGSSAGLFSGADLPAIFERRFSATPSSGLSASVLGILGLAVVGGVMLLSARLGRWVGVALPTASTRTTKAIRRGAAAVVALVVALLLFSLSVEGLLALLITIGVDVAAAAVILGVISGVILLIKRRPDLDLGAFVLVAVLLLPGAYGVATTASVAFGLGHTVDFTVTRTEDRSVMPNTGSEPYTLVDVDGTYELDGERHTVTDKRWYGDTTAVPAPGESTQVTVGPLWPNPLFPDRGDAPYFGALGLGSFVLVFLVFSWILVRRSKIRAG